MVSMHLNTLVDELCRPGSYRAYLFLSDTEENAIGMYALVKAEIIGKKIPHEIVDFSRGLAALPSTLSYRSRKEVLLLEHTASVPAAELEELNNYVKRLTDNALGPIVWYFGLDVLGRMNQGYGSRAQGAFVIVTELNTEITYE